MENLANKNVPEAVVVRVPSYVRTLERLLAKGETSISSKNLATHMKISAAQVRKDLSQLGNFGQQGVGYEIAPLRQELARLLGESQDWPVVIIGAGRLGQALASHEGLGDYNFRVVAVFDADLEKVGLGVGPVSVQPISELAKVANQQRISIGIVATPPEGALNAFESLSAAGIRSILNLSTAELPDSENVTLRNVDLAQELQILSFAERQRTDQLDSNLVTN